jgi:hypothetical protein
MSFIVWLPRPQVDGLMTELKTKAEARHLHNCHDVDGLKELVSTKADRDAWLPQALLVALRADFADKILAEYPNHHVFSSFESQQCLYHVTKTLPRPFDFIPHIIFLIAHPGAQLLPMLDAKLDKASFRVHASDVEGLMVCFADSSVLRNLIIVDHFCL